MTELEVEEVLQELKRTKASEGTLIARAIEAMEWLKAELADIEYSWSDWGEVD